MNRPFRIVLAGIAASALALLPATAPAADYYVSPTGNDQNAGTSSGSPWKTLSKVNGRNFVAGDRILLQGGQTFSGGLLFNASDTGTAANPITVTSYGSGRATVNSGSGDGFYAYNTAGMVVSRLVFVGSGAATNTKAGILFYTDLPGGVKLAKVHLDDVDVSGYRHGISIGSWNGTTGYTDVSVTNAAAHHNQRVGMSTYAQARYGHTNVYVGHSRFYSNLGDPALTTNSGSGLVLGEVDGAVVERSLAWGNGGSSTANEGAVGIWTYDSNNVTIQHCESFDNRTGGPADGGGFDLDGGVTNSVMQYNYSHGNDGAGYGLYQYSGASTWNNNVVRYNVSENDGRRNGYGAIQVWNGGSGIANCDIYGNTIFVSPSATGTPRALRFFTASTNFRFRNNLIVSTGGVRLLEAPAGQSGAIYQGNNWWTSGGAFSIAWNGTNYTSLAAWSTATGHEKVAGTLVGKNLDPLLNGPGAGGTIGNADSLETLAAYRLQASSPMINAGVDLASFGIAAGARDYFGTALPQGAFDIGAHEVGVVGPPNAAPEVSAASASPNPVTATTTALTATATDDGGEAALVYTWSTVSAPSGGSAAFAPNGTNAAKSATATFSRTGSYTLRVTARDAQGATATRDVAVTVLATVASIAISPTSVSVKSGATAQFVASVRDQFGVAVAPQPAVTWSISGPNTISATGLATAGATAGAYVVTATSSGKSANATLTVTKKGGKPTR